jgi:hypothetical protein
MAAADGQDVAALGQALHHIAPDKSGAAEDCHPMLFHRRSDITCRLSDA